MKGFFLSMIFFPLSLLQMTFAQQPSLIVESDTVELGQKLIIRMEDGSFDKHQERISGVWEIFSQTETTIELINFSLGIHPLPIFSFRLSPDNTDTISSSQLIVVQAPLSTQQSESVRTIAPPLTIPSTWRDWAPQLAAICGVFLWTLLWLLATVRQYGPSEKKIPPPTAKALAIAQLQHVNKEDSATVISQCQKVFRSYLTGMGMEGARTVPSAELFQLIDESGLEKESFREIVSNIENLDRQRFSGEAVSGPDATHFFVLVEEFIAAQPEYSRTASAEFVAQYGQQAKGIRRMIGGWLDLFPGWLIISGLLMWPGFINSVSVPQLFFDPINACLIAIIGAFLLRTIAAWITIPGPWKATPGMRLMKLAVVGESENRALRPLVWILASVPLFLGHFGIFRQSGRSLVDTLLRQEVRYYPKQKGKG